MLRKLQITVYLRFHLFINLLRFWVPPSMFASATTGGCAWSRRNAPRSGWQYWPSPRGGWKHWPSPRGGWRR